MANLGIPSLTVVISSIADGIVVDVSVDFGSASPVRRVLTVTSEDGDGTTSLRVSLTDSANERSDDQLHDTKVVRGQGGQRESDEEGTEHASPPTSADASWVGMVEASAQLVTFGRPHVVVQGEPVRSGLRRASREMLLWLAAHRRGGPLEALADAICPDATGPQGKQRIRASIGCLRAALRRATGAPGRVFVAYASETTIYSLDTGDVYADLWQFETLLDRASRSTDAATVAAALTEAIHLYRGEFAEGFTSRWIEPIRQALRRQVLDALSQLASLRAPIEAIALLRRAIEIDPYAEHLYHQLAALYGQLGQTSTARRIRNDLADALAELDGEGAVTTSRPSTDSSNRASVRSPRQRS